MTATNRTILIDGYNLSLQKGTGVATYARNLSKEIGAIGHDVAVLYGSRSSMSRDALLREVSFFDTDAHRQPGKLGNVLQQCYHAVKRPFGQTAQTVPVTGKVVTRAFSSKLPHFDRMFNAPDVFRRAQSGFKLWGKLASVTPPEMPDLAHWTYPLPIRVPGRPNLYTLHDMVPLRLPYTTLDNKRAYLKLIRELDRTADHFVTVSECSKRDLVEVAGIAPSASPIPTNRSISLLRCVTSRMNRLPVRWKDTPTSGTRITCCSGARSNPRRILAASWKPIWPARSMYRC
ncbi:glycosyltransferase [Novosphingobium sp. 9]|uniref:glycosyltransferase n=1 Tax=Novosphingobium sp. 9 TaxID=2025349 RepID=UPI0021B54352|nr:glycosyltransferase [Novosphingobium sp. 9]